MVPVYAIPYSWYQQYQRQYQQLPPFNYNHFNTQLWHRLCNNSYITTNLPNCSGVGVGTYQLAPTPPIILPKLYQQGLTSSQIGQCINGECIVTTCYNFVCSNTGTPPSQTGQSSSSTMSTCVNRVCETCINGLCQDGPSSTQTLTQSQSCDPTATCTQINQSGNHNDLPGGIHISR